MQLHARRQRRRTRRAAALSSCKQTRQGQVLPRRLAGRHEALYACPAGVSWLKLPADGCRLELAAWCLPAEPCRLDLVGWSLPTVVAGPAERAGPPAKGRRHHHCCCRPGQQLAAGPPEHRLPQGPRQVQQRPHAGPSLESRSSGTEGRARAALRLLRLLRRRRPARRTQPGPPAAAAPQPGCAPLVLARR